MQTPSRKHRARHYDRGIYHSLYPLCQTQLVMSALTGQRLYLTILFFGSSFLLHLLWENLQAPLYQGYISFAQHFWICLRATLSGDMLFMLIIYAILALVHRNFFWPSDRTVYRRPITWIIALLVGTILAVSFEWWALSMHRWVYGTMPIVLGIGIFPILQMIIVPLMTLMMTMRFLSFAQNALD